MSLVFTFSNEDELVKYCPVNIYLDINLQGAAIKKDPTAQNALLLQ